MHNQRVKTAKELKPVSVRLTIQRQEEQGEQHKDSRSAEYDPRPSPLACFLPHISGVARDLGRNAHAKIP